jgi:hypothetical protein
MLVLFGILGHFYFLWHLWCALLVSMMSLIYGAVCYFYIILVRFNLKKWTIAPHRHDTMGSDIQSCIRLSSEHGGNICRQPTDMKRSSETFSHFSSTISFFIGNRTCTRSTRAAALSMQDQSQFTTILLSAALLHLTRTFQNSWHSAFCSRTQMTRRSAFLAGAISRHRTHKLRSKSSSGSWSIVDSVFFVATRWLPQRQLSSFYQARFRRLLRSRAGWFTS